ncbi:MAG: DUF2332 family protein [Pseudomonadota bacterium]
MSQSDMVRCVEMSVPQTAQPLSKNLAAAFEKQAQACRKLGSPFTADICEALAAYGMPDLPLRKTLEAWPGDPTANGNSLPLRTCAALHELVLSGSDPALAAVYPPAPGRIDTEMLHSVVAKALIQHEPFIHRRLNSAPQTNEIRRAAAIYAALLHICARYEAPLILSEIGASAGLNLQLDQFRYRLGDLQCGLSASTVELNPSWHGPQLQPANVTVVERRGCDLAPFDLSKEQQRNRLLSYIWADQDDRLKRTHAALELAQQRPVEIDQSNAPNWLEQRLTQTPSGHGHVIFHTIAWQYLDREDQKRATAIIERAGARSTSDTPLFLIGMEADGESPGASLQLREWPAGGEVELARVDFHGRWLAWNVRQ